MTNTQHTPAPWSYNQTPQTGYYNVERADGVIIGRFTNEADATLGSTAPELLEALELMEALFTNAAPHLSGGVIGKVRAAIKKAKGD